jgi:beta-lactamase class D
MRESPGIGWWVGWLEKGDKIYPFAINLDINDPDKDGPKRMTLARASLKWLGLME